MSDRTSRPWIRLVVAGVAACLLSAPALADDLRAKGRDATKLRQAEKLYSDYQSKKLSPEDQKAYEQWLRKAKQQERQALAGGGKVARKAQGKAKLATPQGGERPPKGATGLAAAGQVQTACHCTATCQTVLVVNGGSIYFEGEGEVSSPSACADAAEAFCGSAVSSFLHHWNCK